MGIAKSLVIIQWFGLGTLILGVLTQRFQILPFKVAFGSFALALLVLSVTAVVALLVLALSFGPLSNAVRMPSMMAFVLGFIPLVVVISVVGSGFKVPRIHDISTDPSNPLVFKHAQSLRKPGENSIAPPSEKTLKLQAKFYTDIQPLSVDLAPEKAYERSLSVVNELGWELTHSDKNERQIEALERTALFGFVDDIVIKVSPKSGDATSSVINLRSVSRVGKSDLGANAKRIKRFFEAFEQGK